MKNWRKSKSSEDGGSSAAEPTNNETAGIGPWVSVKKEDVNSAMLGVSSWILGSPCRAVWSQDGLEYEAKIVGIVEPNCTIRFVGKSYGCYNNDVINQLVFVVEYNHLYFVLTYRIWKPRVKRSW